MSDNSTAYLILFLIFYMFPWMIAASRKHLSTAAIFFLNLFLGWTFLGWVAAFVWACTSNTRLNRQREQESLARLIARQHAN
jgi:Superinfection immunity protein